jgi:hypothetical protein
MNSNKKEGTALPGAPSDLLQARYNSSLSKRPFFEYARKYHESGYPVFPVDGKRPVIPGWQRFCSRLPSDQELSSWEAGFPAFNFGLACGPASGIVALDLDTDDPIVLDQIFNIIPGSPVRKRGSKGETLFFRFNDHISRKVRLRATGRPVAELLSIGCQTVLPPSLHPETGSPYFYKTEDTLLNYLTSDLPHLPLDAMERLSLALKQLDVGAREGQGGRNETLKAQAIAAIAKGKGDQEIADELLSFDRKRHDQPLFSDSSDPQMRNNLPADNALHFVERIRRSATSFGISPRIAPTKQVGSIHDWPELKPLRSLIPTVPSIDAQAAQKMLPPALYPWILDISERMGVPIESVAVIAFGSLSGVIGRKIGIMPKRRDDWLVAVTLWTMVVARPGKKKTPMINEATKPLSKLESDAKEVFKAKVAASSADSSVSKARVEAIKEELKAAAKIKDETEIKLLRDQLESLSAEAEANQLIERRYKTNDATVEKLGELLRQNPNGLLMLRDELSGWMKSLDKLGREGDREFFLEAWNGKGSFSIDRIGRGSLHIPALFLTVIGGIQPGKLQEFILESAKGGAGDDGLLQRFQLAVFPDSAPYRYIDRAPDKVARDRVYKIFSRLDNLNAEAMGGSTDPDHSIPFLRFDEAGQVVFDEWISDLEQKLYSETLEVEIESHLSKYRSLVPALALVFHAVDVADGQVSTEGVGAPAVKKAVAWCELLEAHAIKIYSFSTASKQHCAQTLATKLKKQLVADGDTLRSIYRHGWVQLKTQDQVEAACEILEEAGWLKCEKMETGGSPTTIVRIHPDLQKGASK